RQGDAETRRRGEEQEAGAGGRRQERRNGSSCLLLLLPASCLSAFCFLFFPCHQCAPANRRKYSAARASSVGKSGLASVPLARVRLSAMAKRFDAACVSSASCFEMRAANSSLVPPVSVRASSLSTMRNCPAASAIVAAWSPL